MEHRRLKDDSPFICRLTANQQREYERCLERLLSPGHERASVEAAVRGFYACAGLSKPFVFWCDSPWQICVMPFLLQMLLHRYPSRDREEGLSQRYYQELCQTLTEPMWSAAVHKLTQQLSPEIERALGEPEDEEALDPKYVKAFNWSLIGMPVYNRLFDYIGANMRDAYETSRQKLSYFLEARLSEEVRTRVLPFEQVTNWLSGSLWVNPGRAFADTVSPQSNRSRRLYCSDVLAQQLSKQVGGTIWEDIVRSFPTRTMSGRAGPINSNLSRHIGMVLGAELYDVWSSYANNKAAYFNILNRIFADEMFDATTRDVISDLDRFFSGVFAYAFFGKIVFLCKQPALKVDEQNRLHCNDAAAIQFPDGYSLYALHGIEVPAEVIEQPGVLTTDLIDRQSNIELRRVLIDRFGIGKYLEDTGASKIDESEFGALYEKGMLNDEPIVMVRVRNSTPEQDGTHKFYFLRVPPDIRTAKDAVAWTFGMPGDEYRPGMQT
ncbi:MAG TPA: hypothetical protein V6C81_18225 [Planktothrix sp.]